MNCQVYAQSTQFMSLRDVKVGMQGIGKTVISGRKIESFDVEVLGILANNKVSENLLINGHSLLVKVSGEVIENAGGIAAGMSGSPVYIDNKLVGGISSGWVMTDHTVGLVTPIEEMLEIWDYPDVRTAQSNDSQIWNLKSPVRIGNKKIKSIIEVPYNSDTSKIITSDSQLIFKHAAPEIQINGLSQEATKLFNKSLGKNRIVSNQKYASRGYQVSNLSDKFEAAGDIFEPGSAIGIQLARGDINMTTLATLTHREGHRILAMAHPFLKRGNVAFLMTGAYIYHSFSSVEMPFKIGAPTEMIGIISQDREKGLSGEIGRYPSMVPIQIDVLDKDLDISRNINYQIVKDPAVFKMVLQSTLFQALEGVIDREGGGTALMGISLDCANSEGETYSFRRENLFYSGSDIVNTLVSEVENLAEMVIDNEIEQVMPTRIVLKIEIESQRRTLSIEKIEIKNVSISGGGLLNAEVTLRPFRSNSFVRKASLPLPQNIGSENLTLSVSGLNMRPGDMTQPHNERLKDFKDADDNYDFDSSIRTWANSPKNSDLIFELYAEGDELNRIVLNGKDFMIQPTNQVVFGRVDTTLTLSEEQ